MTTGNVTGEIGKEPIFAARLTPHRSLSPTGFVLVMLALVSCSFTAGLAFWMMGAWPVVGFFGLDILLVQLAFRMNYRAARASEDVVVFPDRLMVRRTSPSGRATEFSLNPYWARLELDRHPEIGVTGVNLTSHGRRYPIAGFLGPHERESFALALSAALARARAYPA
ncbi:MAG: DUF2244 domain-containing protein [Bauldia sp.]|uniref:DUF2244 domain-containing protein n=1 Tax=Bauldia sp. TaxID=2575872 RepID=UPI001DB357DC|nr:DUF2244 domain-containing protein [Bauldia sp.]MCB1497962.1 DUF2244 domain-containing protein [Bauldia sp.]